MFLLGRMEISVSAYCRALMLDREQRVSRYKSPGGPAICLSPYQIRGSQLQTYFLPQQKNVFYPWQMYVQVGHSSCAE